MRHRSLSLVVSLAVLAALVMPLLGTQRVLAQDDAEPTSLFQVTLDDAQLPPAPVFVRLLRITMDPGSSSPNHTHPGPELWLIESGDLTVEVDGPTIMLRAQDGSKSEAAPVKKEFTLSKGDQITFIPGTALTFTNKSKSEVKILASVILPAGHQRPPGITYVGGQPSADAFQGIRSDILGDGLADILPSGSVTISIDRLDLKTGQALPANPNPTLLSVVKSTVELTVKSGRVQITHTANPGPQNDSALDQAYTLVRGDAAFFPAGMKETERSDDLADMSLYRLIISGDDGPATPVTEDQVGEIQITGPQAPAATPTPAVTATPEVTEAATEAATQAPTKEPTKEPTAEPTKPGTFTVGQTVYVNDTDVRLRDAPTTDSNIVTGLTIGQALTITGEPTVADDITWWPVVSPDDDSYTGWVAEQFLSTEAPPQ